MQDERYSAIECILFVSGEPVSLVQLQRALDITGIEMNAIYTTWKSSIARRSEAYSYT